MNPKPRLCWSPTTSRTCCDWSNSDWNERATVCSRRPTATLRCTWPAPSSPDLCVLDVMMPKRSGFDVLRELRADERFNSTKVIMLTARAQDRDVDAGFSLGADDYVTKPFSPNELRVRISAHLNRR